jgi:hypothetical protein
MEDELVAGLFFAGGFGVLISYLFLLTSGAISKLIPVFSGNTWRLWALSALITVASVIGVYVHFSFNQRMEGWARDLFITSTCLFIGFAMLWSYSIFRTANNGLDNGLEKIILAIVGMATIGILVSVVEETENRILIAAASLIVFHHVFFDALVWGTNSWWIENDQM